MVDQNSDQRGGDSTRRLEDELRKVADDARMQHKEDLQREKEIADQQKFSNRAVQKVKGGAQWVGNKAKPKLDQIAQEGSFWFILLLGLTFFVIDASFGFPRTGSALAIYSAMWVFYGFIVYVLLPKDGFWDVESFKTVSWRTLLAIFLPTAGYYASQFLNTATIGAESPLFLIVQIFAAIVTPLFGAYLAWPASLIGEAAKTNWFFKAIHIFILLGIFATALMGLFAGSMGSSLLSQGFASGDPVSFIEVFQAGWESIKELGVTVWSGVTGEYETRLGNATQRYYTGTVEQQSGANLGVRIVQQEGLKPVYEIQEQNTTLIPLDDNVVWFGDVEARTFVDQFPVALSCAYILPNRTIVDEIPATPDSVTVFYTGADFAENFPFTCEFPMRTVIDSAEEQQYPAGSFNTIARFDFETWGYATLAFADRQLITEYRRAGQNPARQMGLEPTISAQYTPGPAQLGMFERQSLPIGISANESLNFLPAFGITLSNAWNSRGEVTDIERIILQVPQPLTLDWQECQGIDDAQPQLFSQGPSPHGEVPPGYTWYVYEDLTIDDDPRHLRTIRCPFDVQGSYQNLLAPDLSPRQLSVVARAEYSFELRQRTPISTRAVRI